jgi:hypothetical protein
MLYILNHKNKDRDISRHYTVLKEAQQRMWDEFKTAKKEYGKEATGLQGGDWCEITFPDKTKETWDIISVDIPKTEKIGVTYNTKTNIVYYITQKEIHNGFFFLYKYDKDTKKTEKLGKAKTPFDLEKKFLKK